MSTQINETQNTTVVAAPAKTLFQILEERNSANITRKEPTFIGTSTEFLANSLSVITGSVEAVAKGIELGNSYITEELDRQVANRTETKVDATIAQLTAIGKLVALGATAEEATHLATSYRR